MPRAPRTIIPGHVHHLLLRGNNGAKIFSDDSDRERFLDILRDAALTHQVAVHAYGLMDNHLHLLLTPSSASALSRMVQSVGRNYVVAFNRKHQRSGTLWEGRFRAHLVEAQTHLLPLMRFIECKPEGALLASALLGSRCSSLAHHLGERRDPLITEHALYWALGNTPFEREAAYRRWMEEGPAGREFDDLQEAMKSSRPFASPEFVANLQKAYPLPLSPRPRGRPRKDSGTI